jgi:hypothetical protein
MKRIRFGLSLFAGCCLALVTACGAWAQAPAHAGERPLPRLVEKDGRYALMVDGAPYLILGAQVNNSSAWPAMLPKVWPAMEALHVNTVEIPIYWEQFEPQQGHFDTTLVDTILKQAREHRVRLVVLWFGTWKNGSGHYQPEWMKLKPELYPHLIGADGRALDSPSPHAEATLKADILAFTALMRHLKAADPQRTVIMVQVENEPGTWGGIRDYSPAAQKLFDGPVPSELLAKLNKQPGTWQQVFGEDADEFFHAWSVAHYIGQVAAAGKAVYPLPMYVNAALRDPLKPSRPPNYESGGPTDNVLDIYKAAAPAIDILTPDIYMAESDKYLAVLDHYHRADNALFVPETGSFGPFSRYFFAVLGRQAIGFSPFGMDDTNPLTGFPGAPQTKEDRYSPFAVNYELAAPMQRELARLSFEGKLHAAVEEKDKPTQSFDLGAWKAAISYGRPGFGQAEAKGNPETNGRVLVAQLADNQFLVAGFHVRVDFEPADQSSGKQRLFLKVEEGQYENGVFRAIRIWNGDQTDYGLNFAGVPQLLRVSVATY